MAGYAVDPAQLVASRSVLAGSAAEARRELASLTHAADALLGRWNGAAGTDFAGEWHEWHDGAVAMIDALQGMARALGTCALDYETTDTSVQAAVAGTSS